MNHLILIVIFIFASPLNALSGESQKENNIESVTFEKGVIFFTLSNHEYAKTNGKEREDLDEVLGDFYHYQKSVSPFLKENELKQIITAKKQIVIRHKDKEKTIYNKSDFKHVVGLIMFQNKKDPKVFLGVETDIDLIEMFKDYFEIK